ncbi:piriformospora indica-insensitive protein 2-like [Corylus avellana]|uniref:piriformospora indica-insensitive protein 2-like n=1 Tax=Corylus avellana TaxID=13451 RepID=UPI00286A4CA5|nr:piriformospora indica-insensitive protein 2-like [Corylus avellana]
MGRAMRKSVWTFQMFVRFVCVIVWLFVLCKGQEDMMSSSIGPMKKQEQEALFSAIQGFVGNSWNGSDLYPDPCGWTPIQGVSCDLYDGFWYVTAIKVGPVYDNSLRCTRRAGFTHHLFMLKHLRILSFFNCFFSPHKNPVRIPTSNWEIFTNTLQSLEFRSNPGLIGTIPNTIGYLKNLQSLVILHNGLRGELPPEIGNLVKLRRLVLAGNRFVGRIPESFGDLIELLIIDLSRNKVSGSLPLTFGNLTSLLKLDLSNNMLKGELPAEIGRLRNLTVLDLGSNKFSGGLAPALEQMVSLKDMVISNNPIGGDLNGIQWQKLKELEVLDLSHMGLKGEIPESMTELKMLRFLGLNNNSLSGNVSPRLGSLPCITSLYVYGNNLTGKLEFSEGFYRKMGKRFGAWDNPNLCHLQGALMSETGNFPNGFEVGGDHGWVVPKAKHDRQMYNQWASQNRFKVDDTVHFKFKKDSVLVVSEEEYEKCHSAHPLFFANDGDGVFKLDRPGLFYFISGAAGHCERGQKMIVKVIEPADPPKSDNNTTADSSNKSGATAMAVVSSPAVVLFMLSFFGVL